MFEKKGRHGMPSAPKSLGILIGIGGKPKSEGKEEEPPAERPAPKPSAEEPAEPAEGEAGNIADLGEKYGLRPEDAEAFADELFALARKKVGGGKPASEDVLV